MIVRVGERQEIGPDRFRIGGNIERTDTGASIGDFSRQTKGTEVEHEILNMLLVRRAELGDVLAQFMMNFSKFLRCRRS